MYFGKNYSSRKRTIPMKEFRSFAEPMIHMWMKPIELFCDFLYFLGRDL
jgi:hypothetical protein